MSGDKRDQASPFPPQGSATPAGQQSVIGQPDVTIDMLQDDVLLYIFDSYRNLVSRPDGMWKWQKLLHICQRWRHIVLASPRRLDLRIECDRRTPTWKLLDIWPPFPIYVTYDPRCREGARGIHNIFAALQRRNRISQIDLYSMTSREVDQIADAIDEPFPVLTDLSVQTLSADLPDVTAELPDSFLGGSAPCLQSFFLEGTAFPALPNLVLSASHFRTLYLFGIPHAGYIPPEAMVAFLLPLHNLKHLTIGFTSPESRPQALQTDPPSLTHALLPSLTKFGFHGASEYLLDFIARIDAPMLNSLHITFSLGAVPDILQLHTFIDRTDRLKTFIQAEVFLLPYEVRAIFKSPANPGLDITCRVPEPDWPLSSMMRLYEQLLTIPSQVEQLELRGKARNELGWYEAPDDPRWLQLLVPFVSVKSLYVFKMLCPFVASVLEDLTGDGGTNALPTLNNLFLEGFETPASFDEAIKAFLSMRHSSGHPVAVGCW